MNASLRFILLHRLVAVDLDPSPMIRAVRMALLPLPLLPTNKLMRLLKFTTKLLWHMKFFNTICITLPLRIAGMEKFGKS